MLTPAEFKATVQDYIERSATDQLPHAGESMLVGHRTDGGWKRLRIKRRLLLVAPLVVRGFILEFKIDRLAIVVAGDAPREFRVVFTEREGTDEAVSDARLARLVKAARCEWSSRRRAAHPMRTLFGVPWPIPVLGAALLLELIPGLTRLLRGIPLTSPAVYILEVVLVVATVVMLWRGSRIGYGLALVLSAVQFTYPLTVYVPYVSSLGLGAVVPGLLLSWSYPALIWLLLLLLWSQERRANLRRDDLGSGA